MDVIAPMIQAKAQYIGWCIQTSSTVALKRTFYKKYGTIRQVERGSSVGLKTFIFKVLLEILLDVK